MCLLRPRLGATFHLRASTRSLRNVKLQTRATFVVTNSWQFIHYNLCRNRYNGAWFIVPVVLFAFFYTLPKFFELRIVDDPEVRLIPTSLRKNKIYIRVYLICLNFVVQILVPFTVLIIFNFLTYRTIKESEKALLQNIRSAQKHNVMLLLHCTDDACVSCFSLESRVLSNHFSRSEHRVDYSWLSPTMQKCFIFVTCD